MNGAAFFFLVAVSGALGYLAYCVVSGILIGIYNGLRDVISYYKGRG